MLELHEALTPPGCALELDVVLDEHGVARATWRLKDGRPVRRVSVGRA